MACWLVKPTSLQISSWTRSGSPTGICPPVVWERCSQKLSLTPESSHESRPHFPFQWFICQFAHTYMLFYNLVSGDVASPTADLAHKHVLKKPSNSFSSPSTSRLKPETKVLSLTLSPTSMSAEIRRVRSVPKIIRPIQLTLSDVGCKPCWALIEWVNLIFSWARN